MKIQVIGFDTFKDLYEKDVFFGLIIGGVIEGSRDDYCLHDGFFLRGLVFVFVIVL